MSGYADKQAVARPSCSGGYAKPRFFARANSMADVTSAGRFSCMDAGLARGASLQDVAIVAASQVFVGHASEECAVAVKFVDKKDLNAEEMECAQTELELHRKVSQDPHCAVLPLLACEETDTRFILIMPLADMRDLWQHIRYGEVHPESEVRNFASQILNGLKHLHASNVCHRDIKPQNVLLFKVGHKIVARICDFGLSKAVSGQEGKIAWAGMRGSSGYYSPEMFREQDYGVKVDIWAVGIIIFRMLVGYTPFHPATSYQEQIDFDECSWEHLSAESQDFVSQLLRLSPDKRPSAEEALHHPWFSPANSLRPDGQPGEYSGCVYPNPTSEKALLFYRQDELPANPKNLLPKATQQYLDKWGYFHKNSLL